ncbi:MAG: phosphoribosylformylglycinamidine synthase, partial [Nitrospiraceae bacterium]
MSLLYRYKKPAVADAKKESLLTAAKQTISPEIQDITTEYCFYVEAKEALSADELDLLRWLLSETFEPENYSSESFLADNPSPLHPPLKTGVQWGVVLEVGPRMNFTTAWSTNAVSVCHACGLSKITRIERSRRFKLESAGLSNAQMEKFASGLHDRMTECIYPQQLETFDTGIKPEPVYSIPLIENGKAALEKINAEMGLGLDDWDIDYYYNLFVKDIGRNPTNVECFDLSQSNSEHSRHWFFKGRLVIDGKEVSENLMEIIRQTLDGNPNNSVIAFKDNSSAIRGYHIDTISPEIPGA